MLMLFLKPSSCVILLTTKCQQKGQGLIEYAMIILLIILGVIAILGLFGSQVEMPYQAIVDEIVAGN